MLNDPAQRNPNVVAEGEEEGERFEQPRVRGPEARNRPTAGIATERTRVAGPVREERTEAQRILEAEIEARVTAQMLQQERQRVTNLEEEIARLRLQRPSNPRSDRDRQSTPVRDDHPRSHKPIMIGGVQVRVQDQPREISTGNEILYPKTQRASLAAKDLLDLYTSATKTRQKNTTLFHFC